MSSTIPKVSIAMSSYNGEKYIAEQIDSILGQKKVQVNLVIRDDGSNDSTIKIIEKYLNRENVTLYQGENVGFQRSFMNALFLCPESDYYAFSDQDDVWHPEKLYKTIEKMGTSDIPKLGYCNYNQTDENLNITGNGYPDSYGIPAKPMVFSSCVAAGFLMIINKKMYTLLEKAGELIPTTHDVWVGAVAKYLGEIYYLKERLVLHRRLKNSVSRLSTTKLLKNRTRALLHDQGINVACSKLMLETYSKELSQADKDLLKTIENYRNEWQAKKDLLKNKDIVYETKYGKLTPKIKILLNRF